MGDTVLPTGTSYEEVYARFRWAVPAAYKIAVDVCDRHAQARATPQDPSGADRAPTRSAQARSHGRARGLARPFSQ